MIPEITPTNEEYAPSIIDLFCGVGGLSLGATRAGFSVAAAVDHDPRVEAIFRKNFPGINYINADISQFQTAELLSKAGLSGRPIAGIIGGPPCQGFSRIGKRKAGDDRNSLFEHFFRIVSEAQPKFYVAENVLGIQDYQFDAIRDRAFSLLGQYHNIGPVRLKASDYGCATSRERVFFIGIRSEAFKPLDERDFSPPRDLVSVNVQTALSGLPRQINPKWQTEEQGWRHVSYGANGPFWDRVSNHIPQGVGDPEAIRRLQEEKRISGCLGTRHTEPVVARFRALKEGSVDSPSRAVRLRRKGYCPTLRSGTGPERGSFQALRPIHPTQPRVITPREAARLQGFPDWFQFDGTKWHSFRMIGNSVSPILAENILSVLRSAICNNGRGSM